MPADLRRDADTGPVVMPNYTLFRREDLERLLDQTLDDCLGKIAWGRRNDEITATWDEVRTKYGL